MNQPPDLLTVSMKLFGSLGFILLVVLAMFYALKQFMRLNNFGSKDNLIQILETRYLGGKKSIAVLKVPSAFLVVGLSGDRINLLAHIDEEKIPNITESNRNVSENSSVLSAFFKSSPKIKNSGSRDE